MANKWMRKLGMGMSVIMTVSQLSGMMVFAAPENSSDDEIGFMDVLDEKFEEESDTCIDDLENDIELIETESEDIVCASANIIDSGTCGDNLTWNLDNDGLLTIAGEGKMNNYSDNNVPWYTYRDEIIDVVIKNGVTSIGSFSFANCKEIVSVNLPESLTNISHHAFGKCIKLQSIELPNSLDSLEGSVFSGCESLKSMVFPANLNCININTCTGCTALESVCISDGITAIYENAFDGCELLSEVIFLGSETKWNSIIIQNGNENLKNSKITFSAITEPKSGTLGDNAKWILDSNGILTISGTGKITSACPFNADNSFRYTKKLIINEGITGWDCLTFDGCSDLITVVLPSTIENIGINSFAKCFKLKSIIIPQSVESISRAAFANCTSLSEITLPENMEMIEEYTFSECTSLCKITIPSKIHIIYKYAFSNCHLLKDVFYSGTKENWKKTSIKEGNECLYNAIIHCSDGDYYVVQEIVLDTTEMTLEAGDSKTILATPTPKEADSTVEWFSSDPSVAIVDENGKVTAISTGTAKITATATNGTDDTTDDKSVTCVITVVEPRIAVLNITLDETEKTIEAGGTVSIVATLNPTDATEKEIIWSTDNSAVATVNESGLITAISEGTAKITATATNGTIDAIDDVMATCTITVIEKIEYIFTPTPVFTIVSSSDNTPTPTPAKSQYHSLTVSAKESSIEINEGDTINISKNYIVGTLKNGNETIDRLETNGDSGSEGISISSKYFSTPGEYLFDYRLYEAEEVTPSTMMLTRNSSGGYGFQYGASTIKRGSYIGTGKLYITVKEIKKTEVKKTDPTMIRCLQVDHLLNEGNDSYISLDEKNVYDYTGFIVYDGGVFIAVSGKLDTTVNGLLNDPNDPSKWYFMSNGQVQMSHVGLALYDGEWFYVNNGLLDTELNAYVDYDGGKFFVGAGRIMSEVSGLAMDPQGSDWYYLAGGQAQTQYTGLAQYDGAWFYVIDGKLAQEYITLVDYDGNTFCSVNGMLKDYSSLNDKEAIIASFNYHRHKAGLQYLGTDVTLSEAAQIRANEVSYTDSIATRPNGKEANSIFTEYPVDCSLVYNTRATSDVYHNPSDISMEFITQDKFIIDNRFNKIGIGITQNFGKYYWYIILTD